MLVAVALDANDCIYPVAYALVERENATAWRWFIQHLGEDLWIVNSNEWIFMTDRQKGLQNVIEDLYPEAEHRFCVRHMYTNFFMADFKGLTLKEYLWRAAKSTTVPDWKFWMDEIEKMSKAAHGWLMKRHPSEWSKAYFLTKVKSDIVLNNLCEVFNNMVLVDREKSILTMLVDLHISFMKRIQLRRDKMRKATGPLCPKIQQKLMKNAEMAEGFEVDWSGGAQSYVKCSNGEYVVDFPNRTCACRRWDLTGIPCAHAIAAILDRYGEPWKYVHECYGVDTYLSCYENIINPINGSKLWYPVHAPPIKPPGWFVTKRGRKQKKRRRHQEEDVITRSGLKAKMKKRGTVLMTCSVSGRTGHNMRYHRRPDAPQEDSVAYDVERTIQERSNQINDDNLRAKLVPRRSNTSPRYEVQPPPPPSASEFQFMPTPGLGLTNDAQYDWSAPPLTEPGSSMTVKGMLTRAFVQIPTENIPVQNMVEDLQQIDAQENAQKRAARAKNRKVVRGSARYAPPRKMTHAATQ
ncbi:uncharacterized protein LOC111374185 [Olea europaea var. sylvestris]|uniref:uncharacterized protein LOC111374185 n=1 Tax=Olea europaea var. sylvestris TaxID=158386 RepID=UPI000C1D3051|nr:uncharacterized protein LOC111374185 [Olea europaea var. sylvestris]